MGLNFHFVLASGSGLVCFCPSVFLVIFSRDSSDSRAFTEILDTKCKGNESHFKLPKDIFTT